MAKERMGSPIARRREPSSGLAGGLVYTAEGTAGIERDGLAVPRCAAWSCPMPKGKEAGPPSFADSGLMKNFTPTKKQRPTPC